MEHNAEYFELRKVNPDEKWAIPVYLKKLLNKKDADILDYGCGYGALLKTLKEEGYSNIHGADINDGALEHLNKIGIHSYNLKKQHPDTKFDVIIMHHVLEHIAKSKMIETMKSVHSLLKKNGFLFITVPNAQSNTGCYWAYEDFTHEYLFTSGSLYYVLKAAGFSKIEFVDIDSTENLPIHKKAIRKLFLPLYKLNKYFWNKVTNSAYYSNSPAIFSWEIKAKVLP